MLSLPLGAFPRGIKVLEKQDISHSALDFSSIDSYGGEQVTSKEFSICARLSWKGRFLFAVLQALQQ